MTSVCPGWIATNPLKRLPQHKDRPEPQRTTGSEENDTEPSDRIAVDGPEVDAVRVGRQIGVQQPKHSKSCEDPAVVTILAHTGAHISAGEKRHARQSEEYDRERGQRQGGEERRKPAPADDGHGKIGSGADENERPSDG